MSWGLLQGPRTPRGGTRISVLWSNRPVAFAEYFAACARDASARQVLLDAWSNCEHEAFFWELPPVSDETRGRDFEFIQNPAPGLLHSMPQPDAFAGYFSKTRSVVEFQNLGNDAQLIVPCPLGVPACYVHLGAFARRAPLAQRHALVQSIARSFERALSPTPLWISTSGTGVAWLHVRLDTRPKYYTHQDYARLEQRS